MERKWMVLRLDSDGVTIVESHSIGFLAFAGKVWCDINKPSAEYVIKFGYPWEA